MTNQCFFYLFSNVIHGALFFKLSFMLEKKNIYDKIYLLIFSPK